MRILLIDIETSANTAYVWGLFQQNISISQIIESSGMLCFAAKWLGEKEVYFKSIMNGSRKSMLKLAHKLLSEADAVIHYNGARFDIPVLMREFLLADMGPPAPFKQIDLLRVARNKFKFASNKLDYVAQALGLGKKKDTNFQLWIDCVNKDPAAWAKMEAYNIQDVILLEKVYGKFLPYITNHPNIGVHLNDTVCPNCGSHSYQRRGRSFLSAGSYQRYQCNACHHWFRDAKMIKEEKKDTFRHAT